jgi:hypothetical protein
MATLSVGLSSRAGLDLTTSAVAASGGGDKFANTGAELFFIKNGGGAPITLTLTFGPGAVVDGQTPSNRTVSVPAGDSMVVGPFSTTIYNDSQGFMNFSYSAVTSVTVAAFKPGSP